MRRTWRRQSGETPRNFTRTGHLPTFGSPQLPGPLRLPGRFGVREATSVDRCRSTGSDLLRRHPGVVRRG